MPKLFNTIAQILLIFFLIPIMFAILSIFSPNSANDLAIELLDNTPMLEIWSNILNKVYAGISGKELAVLSLWEMSKDFFEVIIVSINVYLCNQFYFSLTGVKRKGVVFSRSGLPILSSVIGVFLSVILLKLIGLWANTAVEVITEIVIIVLILFGIKMMIGSLGEKSPFRHFFSFSNILGLFFDGATGFFVSGFSVSVAQLMMNSNKNKTYLFVMISCACCVIVSSLFSYLCEKLKKD